MNLARLKEIWALSREGADHYGIPAVRVFLRFRHLSRKFRFNPEEVCRLGMVDPKLDDDRIRRRYLSKYLLVKIQLQYNPRQFFGLTEDKAVFYAFCRGHKIPHPTVLAVLGPLGGWLGNGTIVKERREWEEYFLEGLPERFLIKPTGGCRGESVRVLARIGTSFEDNEGVQRSAADLYDHFQSGTPTSRWIVQEVLTNHPDLVRLTGSEAISTCRMITLLDSSRSCRLIYAEFRMVVGRNVVDNIALGKTGNIFSDVNLQKGTVNQIKSFGTKWGCPDVEVHPDTGVRLKGFQLPDWPKARDLVESIAPKFLPARMLGWDIAFTPEGPLIVETNAAWDPMNEFDSFPIVVESLREEYERLL